LKLVFFILIFFLNYNNLNANEKLNIINKLSKINSIEFNFRQINNKSEETGKCLLLFPARLNCDYNDEKRKQLIINKKSLAITQRKYNKTYYYPISKSHFVDILNKEKLVNLINQSVINIVDEQINLINTNGIIILFNKSNYNLMGWEIKDKFNNKVSFLIDIISTNIDIDKKLFQIPKLN
jgi:outer membrane lipoprotein-sorting protein|tara:strand:+ start:4409 stop:4951 length:543 start_codon:yes stop_codon:yes gene_type:complete